MRILKDYWCDSTPTDEEIEEAISIASADDCVVNLQWFVKYNGYYRAVITKDDTLEYIKQRFIPRMYGM